MYIITNQLLFWYEFPNLVLIFMFCATGGEAIIFFLPTSAAAGIRTRVSIVALSTETFLGFSTDLLLKKFIYIGHLFELSQF